MFDWWNDQVINFFKKNSKTKKLYLLSDKKPEEVFQNGFVIKQNFDFSFFHYFFNHYYVNNQTPPCFIVAYENVYMALNTLIQQLWTKEWFPSFYLYTVFPNLNFYHREATRFHLLTRLLLFQKHPQTYFKYWSSYATYFANFYEWFTLESIHFKQVSDCVKVVFECKQNKNKLFLIPQIQDYIFTNPNFYDANTHANEFFFDNQNHDLKLSLPSNAFWLSQNINWLFNWKKRHFVFDKKPLKSCQISKKLTYQNNFFWLYSYKMSLSEPFKIPKQYFMNFNCCTFEVNNKPLSLFCHKKNLKANKTFVLDAFCVHIDQFNRILCHLPNQKIFLAWEAKISKKIAYLTLATPLLNQKKQFFRLVLTKKGYVLCFSWADKKLELHYEPNKKLFLFLDPCKNYFFKHETVYFKWQKTKCNYQFDHKEVFMISLKKNFSPLLKNKLFFDFTNQTIFQENANKTLSYLSTSLLTTKNGWIKWILQADNQSRWLLICKDGFFYFINVLTKMYLVFDAKNTFLYVTPLFSKALTNGWVFQTFFFR